MDRRRQLDQTLFKSVVPEDVKWEPSAKAPPLPLRRRMAAEFFDWLGPLGFIKKSV